MMVYANLCHKPSPQIASTSNSHALPIGSGAFFLRQYFFALLISEKYTGAMVKPRSLSPTTRNGFSHIFLFLC